MFPMEFKFKYEQKKSAKEKKLCWIMDKLFIASHWLTIIFFTTASFFTGVPETNIKAYNMTLFCNEKIFDQILTPVDRKWPIVTVLSVSIMVVLLLSFEMLVVGVSTNNFLNIMYYFLGLLLCWDIVYVLQSLISQPIPSFLQNDQLKSLYCCQTCSPLTMTKNVHILDKESRGSFPSFVTCATSYVSVFLFLLTCHLDKGQRFAAKLLALIVPGSLSVLYGWYLWQYNENHLQDVVGGAMIGTAIAVYITKELFVGDNKKEKFKQDFVSVLMARELQLAVNAAQNSNQEGREPNQYTINLYSADAACEQQEAAALEDLPPPYSSL